ncbi:MAG: HAD-IB family hydrolase [Coriobacteriales bacterium]|nr:HAD-IB family hydrolase [Coriobacteriales bacterium]
MKKTEIVAFDFDGTLIDVSSPVRLIARLNRDHIMPKKAIAKSALWGARYKLGKELNQAKPRRYIFSSFKNFSASDANAIMKNLYLEELRPRLLPPGLQCVEEHRRAGRTLVVVSASFEPIIAELAKDLGAQAYICTRMEVVDGSYTGETIGEPPEGEQKLLQFEQWANATYGSGNWVLTHAYGDHFSDVPLMASALHPVAVDPDRRLEALAREKSWEVASWSDG